MTNGKLIDPATGLPYRAGGAQDPSGNTITVPAPLPAGVDRSGTTDAGAKSISASNAARKGFTLQNTSDTDMRLTESDTPASASSGYLVAAGGVFVSSTNRAISLYCSVAGKSFAATEW